MVDNDIAIFYLGILVILNILEYHIESLQYLICDHFPFHVTNKFVNKKSKEKNRFALPSNDLVSIG